MPRWQFNGRIDDDFDDEDFEVTDDYTGFQKISPKKRFEEEMKPSKKKESVKHQKRPDKE
jgi:hypothetical protein